jgi:hypothetical protein
MIAQDIVRDGNFAKERHSYSYARLSKTFQYGQGTRDKRGHVNIYEISGLGTNLRFRTAIRQLIDIQEISSCDQGGNQKQQGFENVC